jgi:two-component system cell cycle sensor histidine kinase/response regulator CckA
MGFGDLILRKEPDEAIKKYTGNIRKASERASRLIRNLLTFSRGEIVEKKIFNLNELLIEVKNLAIPIIPSDIRIYSEMPEKAYFIEGDSGKIHQCILNLCLNAKDAIGEKAGSITIKLSDSQKEGFVIIDVEDTGPGIPPDIIEHIFDPFFSTKKKKKGTGLGLSVVYGIVKSHGGDIILDSRPGEGTTFCIELPTIHHTIEKKKIKKEETKEISLYTSDRSDGLIMIVDDDELMREFCNETIEKQGYPTIQFSDSKKAVRWFKTNSEKIRVVLADIVMPQMDGITMVKHLREIKNDLRVIWMSAYLSPEMKRPSGDDPVLKKPFNSTDLLKTIDSFNKIPE